VNAHRPGPERPGRAGGARPGARVLCADKMGQAVGGLRDRTGAKQQNRKGQGLEVVGQPGAPGLSVGGGCERQKVCWRTISAYGTPPEGECHHTTSQGLGASPERTVEVLTSAIQKGRTISRVRCVVSVRDTPWPGLSEMIAKGRSPLEDPGPRFFSQPQVETSVTFCGMV
jgi:hypothetical protein